jgi:hypothetical protein
MAIRHDRGDAGAAGQPAGEAGQPVAIQLVVVEKRDGHRGNDATERPVAGHE